CGSVFGSKEETYEQSLLGTVPPTGTSVYRVSNDLLNLLLKEQKENIFYLGHSYGSNTKLPMWFKHFGHGPNGAGEAYHLGIFGITGSGKSTLAKMIMTSYAKHNEMSMLILDPVGEFAKTLSESDSTNLENVKFNLNMKEICHNYKKAFQVVHVKNIVLDRWALFSEILLTSKFFQRLTIRNPNRQYAVEVIVSILREKEKVTLARLKERDTFDKVIDYLNS